MIKQKKHFLIINRQAPFLNNKPREALDIALSLATNEQRVSLLFMGDGVFQLVDNPSMRSSFLAAYKSLPLYDIDQIYIDVDDLAIRNITINDLLIDVTPIDKPTIKNIFLKQDIILNF